ncbi:MAG TPA: hypothetical protein DEQ09_00995 [Bacteroidales bacterium]|nr:hypothetical protein [Bacteroidales bacterium]
MGKIKLKKGAEITQADTTFGYIWLEMPGQDFADSFLNDNGVLITSNSCPSREQSGDIVQGGIGYDLRKIVAERAKSARDAVTIAGKLLTDLGYNASGRTYTIADIKEAWMLSVVKGKHWVAMRIPDEHVVYLPNYYIIEEIDFNDKENYLCSPELEEYAIKMNWYDPSTGRFSFREAYGNERSAKSKGNIGRMWVGVNMLSAIEYDMNDSFPVSFVPEKPVTIEKLISILGNHYEGTSLDDSKNYTEHNPHKNKIMNICARHQQLSFVAELRDGQEIETGCRLWLAPRRGCVHAYMPVYYGTKDFPPGYKYYSDNKKVFEMHFQVPDDMYDKNNGKAWWTFYSVTDYIDQDYISRIEDRKNYKDLLQKELFEITAEFDKNIHEKWVKNSSIAADEITVFTGMILEMVLKRNMIYLENR